MVSAVIVAAGSSRRMGFDKLFAPLAGKPVIAHSIAAFERTPEIGEIILVTRPDRIAEFQSLLATAGYKKVTRIVAGGDERHLSVWNGLRALAPASTHVAIHDGARPLITPAVITQCIALAQSAGAACVAVPVHDTVKRASPAAIVLDSVDRSNLWAMQTPQVFSTPLILRAYQAIIDSGQLVTDEVSAIQEIGGNIALLRNDEWNFKITIPRDLELAEYVLTSRGTI